MGATLHPGAIPLTQPARQAARRRVGIPNRPIGCARAPEGSSRSAMRPNPPGLTRTSQRPRPAVPLLRWDDSSRLPRGERCRTGWRTQKNPSRPTRIYRETKEVAMLQFVTQFVGLLAPGNARAIGSDPAASTGRRFRPVSSRRAPTLAPSARHPRPRWRRPPHEAPVP